MYDFRYITRVWEGFEGFRTVLKSLYQIGLDKVDQSQIDNYLPGKNLEYKAIPKQEILAALDAQLNSDEENPEFSKEEILAQKELLMQVMNDVNLTCATDYFDYELIFKEASEGSETVKGFAKATSLTNPEHVALLSWEDVADPILFLAELDGDELRFHINYGQQGLAVVQELENAYRWIHCAQSEFSLMLTAEAGSVLMNKESKEISLEQGNLSAAKALSRSKTVAKNGKNLFENNIELMKLYKADLKKVMR